MRANLLTQMKSYNALGLITLICFLMSKQSLKGQGNIVEFWQLNTVVNTYLWDAKSFNGQVNNGDGIWDSKTANWTTNEGKSNVLYRNGKNVVFGGNPGVGAAGKIRLEMPLRDVNSIRFLPAQAGNFTVTGSTLSYSYRIPLEIFVDKDLAPTIGSVLDGSAELTKRGSGILRLSGFNNRFLWRRVVISNGGIMIAGNYGIGPYEREIIMGDDKTPQGATLTLGIENGVTVKQLLKAVVTTNYAASQFIVNAGSSLKADVVSVRFSYVQLDGNKPFTLLAKNTDGHGSAQDFQATFVGSGIAAGKTALIFDGTAAKLRVTFGGPIESKVNNFTGDVLIKGKVTTKNNASFLVAPNDTRFIDEKLDKVLQNLGFPNNNVQVDRGATWFIEDGQELAQGLFGEGTVSFIWGRTRPNLGIALTIGNNNADGSFAGLFSGGAGYGLAKKGTGTQVFKGTGILMDGPIYIREGTLELKDIEQFGATALYAEAASIWKKSGTSKLNLSWGTEKKHTKIAMTAGSTFDLEEGAVSNANGKEIWEDNKGSVNIGLKGLLDLNGSDLYLDALSGHGKIANSQADGGVKTLFVGVSDTKDNPTFGVKDHTAGFSGAIIKAKGDISLRKKGKGIQLLAGNNTYGGGTFVEEGTLKAGSVNAFGGAASKITVSAGATLDKNGFAIPNPIVNNGGTVKK